MTSKSNKIKNNFSSLSMYRVAEEEINKNKSPIKIENNKNNKNINNFKFNQKENKTKATEKNSRNMGGIKMTQYSSVDNKDFGQIKNFSKINNSRIKVSKEKDKNSINKNSAQTFQPKPVNKKTYKHIDRIIIDLVSNDDNQTNSNYSEKEYMLKSCKTEENVDFDKIKNENTNTNKNNQVDLKIALNCIINRWKEESTLENEANINLLFDDILKKKKQIEFIVDRWKNQKKINQINFSMLKKEGINEEKEKNNIIYRWKNNLEKENKELFTIKKSTLNNDIFLYSEKNYIKDLTKNIYLPNNNENIFYILNSDNYINDFNKIDFRVIKPKNKNELENDLNLFYNEKKINYLKNKDNNEELKINPIYILSCEQINQLYENQNKNKNNNTFENSQLIIEKQKCIDYDIIEIFTPKYKNRDNNINLNTKRNSSFNSVIKNDKVGELNFEGKKKVYIDFGQETPFCMLNEKFYVYAISRNSKYSIPESQGCFNYTNANINNKNFNSNILKQNKFNLKIESCEKIDSDKSQKTTSKRVNEENIIDYSNISGNSNK